MVRLFEGIEVEGRFRGVSTLFVSGDVPFKEIETRARGMNDASICKKYSQIYFGADHCSPVNWNTVKQCMQLTNIVTVELGENIVQNECYYTGNIHLVLRIDKLTKYEMAAILAHISDIDNIQLKFDTTSHSHLAPANCFITNSKKEMIADKEIWRS